MNGYNTDPEHVFNSVWITGLAFGRSHNMTKARAIELLGERGLPDRPFFYPLSSLPAYEGSQSTYEPRNPVSYEVSARGINLRGAMDLSADQIDLICDGIRSILRK